MDFDPMTSTPDNRRKVMKRQRIGSETCPKCEQGIKYNCSNQTVQQRLNYKRGNYKRINENLSNTDWNEVINRSSTNEAWESFADIINRTIKENIPECKVFEKKYDTPWMTRAARDAIRNKKKKWLKYLNQRNEDNKNRYEEAKRAANVEIKKVKVEYEKQLAKNIKTDEKSF